MAKKSSGTSSRDLWSITKFLAFIALLLAVVIFIVYAIIRATDSKNWSGLNIFILIKDLALIGAIAFPAYAFVRPKKQVWQIIYWICLVIVVVAAVLGNVVL